VDPHTTMQNWSSRMFLTCASPQRSNVVSFAGQWQTPPTRCSWVSRPTPLRPLPSHFFQIRRTPRWNCCRFRSFAGLTIARVVITTLALRVARRSLAVSAAERPIRITRSESPNYSTSTPRIDS
jgi:hypothetical protein